MICVAACSRIRATTHHACFPSLCNWDVGYLIPGVAIRRGPGIQATAALDVVWTWYWPEPTHAPSRSLCKIGLLTIQTVKRFVFPKSNMADGRHFENSQIAISSHPFDRFWWNLAWWRRLAFYGGQTVKISNFSKTKMAAAAIFKITKIAISQQGIDRSSRNLASVP